MSPKIVGAVILALPALAAAWLLLWRKQRPVFWFAAAMTVVGVGYLAATGATDDIARKLAPNLITATPARA